GRGCFGLSNCKVVGGYDFVNDDNDPMDDYGHGTHCAAIAAGNGSITDISGNSILIKGVAPEAKIYAYKVLARDGFGNSNILLQALERSIDPNNDNDISDRVDIVSMSLGFDCYSYYNSYNDACGPNDFISRKVDELVNNYNVVVVVSAGNSGPASSTIVSPATARKAITVGANYWFFGWYVASFSSRGPVYYNDPNDPTTLVFIQKPDLVAPGVIICSAKSSGIPSSSQTFPCVYPPFSTETISMSGTSMAAPHVAGAAALLKQKNPHWTPEQIKSYFKYNALPLNSQFTLLDRGQGRLYLNNSPAALSQNYPYLEVYYKKESNFFRIFGTLKNYGNSVRSVKLYLNNNYLNRTTMTSFEDRLLHSISRSSLRSGRNYIVKMEVDLTDGRKFSEFISLIN
ncbi:MAG: S8 family serine peptidase, partial [Candidatus Pacearchaeota archaeon]